MEQLIKPAILPVDGKVRAGVKVPTKTAWSNEAAKKIYKDGVEQGLSFDEIEKQISETVNIKNSLVPKNIPYFVARRCDFKNPDVANQIMDLYGEIRNGDTQKRLWRFPVMFVFDDPYQVIPHSLASYVSAGRKYWSEFTEEGQRVCTTFATIPINENGKAVRQFGGRKHVVRGECIPEQCKEYQSRQCNMSGKILYYIPGIPGAGLIETPLTSFYGMSGCIAQLNLIKGLRSNKLSGLNRDGSPIFWLTKAVSEVPMIKDDGSVTRVKQYIITLESSVITSSLLLERQHQIQGSESALRLNDGHVIDTVKQDPAPDIPVPGTDQTETQSGIQPDDNGVIHPEGMLKTIMDACQFSSINFNSFNMYASLKWGDNWKQDQKILTDILIEVDERLDDPDYRSEICNIDSPI
ncbi:MAG: hypothetical protein KGI54_05825 [Pseudomonadota bacterium]|nr:hypothetical protein [Pseudomonadota bacterium]